MQILFTSTLLPDWLKGELTNLTKTYSWLKVLYLSPQQPTDFKRNLTEQIMNCPEFLKELDSNPVLGVARIDDDDFLSKAYFEDIQLFIEERYLNMCVSLCKGYMGLWREDKFDVIVLNHTPMIALGLCYIASFQREKGFTTPYQYPPGNHSIMDRVVPIILYAKQNYYMRTISDNNDSSIDKHTMAKRYTMDTIMDRGFKGNPQKQTEFVLSEFAID